MKLTSYVAVVILLSFGFIGCYTILSHPTIKRNEYSQKISFYNDCNSCHSNSELINYGYEYLDKYPQPIVSPPLLIFTEPVYTPPWWFYIQVPVGNDTFVQRPNDETKLRNLDGGRTSAPTDFSNPSRNSGSTSNSNSSTNNSSSSSNERSSKESNSIKSRDNSGERKK